MQTLNPGMRGEIVISPGSLHLQTPICDDPNVVTRFPIPNEKAIRRKKAKLSTGVQLREIKMSGNGTEVRAPTKLPFQAPGMQFRGRPSVLEKHL
ncbi:unnamed protein product, partial [Cuscuta epithymum]